jgi:flavin reductase (DIM6/NTAB) family NADH-FMN oxidoreductase RutF
MSDPTPSPADQARPAEDLVDPAQTDWVEVYRRLTDVVIPRPIALVSTVDPEGRPNVAPFSFFTVVSSNPPHLAFSPHRAGRTGAKKDTLRNIEATGQMVIAVVTEAMAEQVNQCAAALPYGTSELEHSGLTGRPAERVRPLLIAESPVNMECELVELHHYGESGGAGSLVVARLVLMHLDPAVRDADGAVAPELLRAVGRMGQDYWVRTRETFPMKRPG